jgi:hypothetical protein
MENRCRTDRSGLDPSSIQAAIAQTAGEFGLDTHPNQIESSP